MNARCSDCGEEYSLYALDLDLHCADCIEQRAIDAKELVK
jgi:DNA-directed RNA polymerase subunit RPC12/RpoP